MSVVVRKALPEDLDQLVKLWMEIMNYHEGHGPYFQPMKDHSQSVPPMILERMDKETILVAEQNSNVVGMIFLRTTDLPPTVPLKKQGYIAETVVDPDQRGKGIGEALVSRAKEHFIEEGCDVMDLQVSVKNEAGIRFWERMGFKAGTYHMNQLL